MPAPFTLSCCSHTRPSLSTEITQITGAEIVGSGGLQTLLRKLRVQLGRVVGTWIMGNDYRVKSGYYGGYPAGYLRRIAALFPDRRHVLHVFSGQVDLSAMPGDTVDSNPAMKPTWVADAHNLSAVPLKRYDLVLADPPYSVEDAERYQTTMVQRNVVMRSLAAGMAAGARVVWLDQVLPMYRKTEWSIHPLR